MRERNQGPSQRQLKVGELIKHALSEIFTSGKIFSTIIGNIPITVSEVRMTPDLKVATAYVLPFGKDIDKESFLKDLENNLYLIRGIVTNKINMKYSPKILFRFDESFNKVQKFEQLFKEIK